MNNTFYYKMGPSGGETFTVTCYTCGMPSSKEWAQRVRSQPHRLGEPYYPFLAEKNPVPSGAVVMEDGSTYLCAFCHALLESQWVAYENKREPIPPKERKYFIHRFICAVCAVETYRKRVRALPFQEFPFLVKARQTGSITLGNNPLAVVCLDCSETLWAQSAEYDRWGLPVHKRHFNWMARPPPPEDSVEATVARLPSGETQLPRCPPTDPLVPPRTNEPTALPETIPNLQTRHRHHEVIVRSPHHHNSPPSTTSTVTPPRKISHAGVHNNMSPQPPIVTVAPMSTMTTVTTRKSSMPYGMGYDPARYSSASNLRRLHGSPTSSSMPNPSLANYPFPWNPLEEVRGPPAAHGGGSPPPLQWSWSPELLRYHQTYMATLHNRDSDSYGQPSSSNRYTPPGVGGCFSPIPHPLLVSSSRHHSSSSAVGQSQSSPHNRGEIYRKSSTTSTSSSHPVVDQITTQLQQYSRKGRSKSPGESNESCPPSPVEEDDENYKSKRRESSPNLIRARAVSPESSEDLQSRLHWKQKKKATNSDSKTDCNILLPKKRHWEPPEAGDREAFTSPLQLAAAFSVLEKKRKFSQNRLPSHSLSAMDLSLPNNANVLANPEIAATTESENCQVSSSSKFSIDFLCKSEPPSSVVLPPSEETSETAADDSRQTEQHQQTQLEQKTVTDDNQTGEEDSSSEEFDEVTSSSSVIGAKDEEQTKEQSLQQILVKETADQTNLQKDSNNKKKKKQKKCGLIKPNQQLVGLEDNKNSAKIQKNHLPEKSSFLQNLGLKENSLEKDVKLLADPGKSTDDDDDTNYGTSKQNLSINYPKYVPSYAIKTDTNNPPSSSSSTNEIVPDPIIRIPTTKDDDNQTIKLENVEIAMKNSALQWQTTKSVLEEFLKALQSNQNSSLNLLPIQRYLENQSSELEEMKETLKQYLPKP